MIFFPSIRIWRRKDINYINGEKQNAKRQKKETENISMNWGAFVTRHSRPVVTILTGLWIKYIVVTVFGTNVWYLDIERVLKPLELLCHLHCTIYITNNLTKGSLFHNSVQWTCMHSFLSNSHTFIFFYLSDKINRNRHKFAAAFVCNTLMCLRNSIALIGHVWKHKHYILSTNLRTTFMPKCTIPTKLMQINCQIDVRKFMEKKTTKAFVRLWPGFPAQIYTK